MAKGIILIWILGVGSCITVWLLHLIHKIIEEDTKPGPMWQPWFNSWRGK